MGLGKKIKYSLKSVLPVPTPPKIEEPKIQLPTPEPPKIEQQIEQPKIQSSTPPPKLENIFHRDEQHRQQEMIKEEDPEQKRLRLLAEEADRNRILQEQGRQEQQRQLEEESKKRQLGEEDMQRKIKNANQINSAWQF